MNLLLTPRITNTKSSVLDEVVIKINASIRKIPYDAINFYFISSEVVNLLAQLSDLQGKWGQDCIVFYKNDEKAKYVNSESGKLMLSLSTDLYRYYGSPPIASCWNIASNGWRAYGNAYFVDQECNNPSIHLPYYLMDLNRKWIQ